MRLPSSSPLRRLLLPGLFALWLVAAPAAATSVTYLPQTGPRTWYLADVVFADGGTASGWFASAKDGAATLYPTVAIAISNAGGPAQLGWSERCPCSDTSLFAKDSQPETVGQRWLILRFDVSLRDVVGTVDLLTAFNYGSSEAVCTRAFQYSGCVEWTNTRRISSGFVTTTAPVPVPAAAWLFGGALGLLAPAARRRS